MSVAFENYHSQSTAQRSPATDWLEAPALTGDRLSGSFWTFGTLEGIRMSPFVVLAPEGLIGNYFHDQIDMWQVVHGRLCFIGKDGLPSIVFNVAQMRGGEVMALAGRGVINGIDAIYIIQRTEHLPHPHGATPPHVERRAQFSVAPANGALRPNLVVVPANSKSLHPRWFDAVSDMSRSWDLCVGYYGEEQPIVDSPYEYLAHLPKRKKFKLLTDLFYEGSPLWNYDRVWLPDDDLLCTGADINTFFHLSRKFGLDLSQPSLKYGPGCYPNHPLTIQRPNSVMRPAGFVEIMCPIFSHRALKICSGIMKDVESGYGLDHLWPSFLGRPEGRMGIIDAVCVAHTRPLGSTYNVQAAVAEQAALFQAYQYTPLQYEGVW